MKHIYTLIAIGLVCAAFVFLIKSYGESREREGMAQIINARQESELRHISSVMAERNRIDTELMASIPAIYDNDDGRLTGPSIGASMLASAPIPERRPSREASKAGTD